jgi:6-methylsalicylate decarboxylase
MTQPTVDIHQHLWPEAFVSALSRRDEPPFLRGDVLHLADVPPSTIDLNEHRLETRLRRLDEAETDVAVVSLQPTLGIQGLHDEEAAVLLTAYHEGVLELLSAADGRLRALAAGECRPGFSGASVSAAVLTDALLEERSLPLLGELERAGAFLFVHPGPARQPPSAPPWWSEVVSYTAEMQAAYVAWMTRGTDRHPRLPVVFAILAGGAPVQLERLASRGVDVRPGEVTNVFLDTASYGVRALDLTLARLGVGQLVFGTDAPVLTAQPALQAVGEFGNAVADVVRRENPSLLLH